MSTESACTSISAGLPVLMASARQMTSKVRHPMSCIIHTLSWSVRYAQGAASATLPLRTLPPISVGFHGSCEVQQHPVAASPQPLKPELHFPALRDERVHLRDQLLQLLLHAQNLRPQQFLLPAQEVEVQVVGAPHHHANLLIHRLLVSYHLAGRVAETPQAQQLRCTPGLVLGGSPDEISGRMMENMHVFSEAVGELCQDLGHVFGVARQHHLLRLEQRVLGKSQRRGFRGRLLPLFLPGKGLHQIGIRAQLGVVAPQHGLHHLGPVADRVVQRRVAVAVLHVDVHHLLPGFVLERKEEGCDHHALHARCQVQSCA
mmetsp:Transcript_34221/g.88863  ORF Transcript_34221/g.88863 Transcript_34221/m.88863 type:complete len:317 (+) Transcript_34221:58-1008(+)